MFQGLRFPFKITPSVPHKFTVGVQIFFIVIVFIHTFWWKGQCVSVSFKIVPFIRIPEKSVFLKRSFQLEVLSPRTYKYDSVENDMERKSSKICISFKKLLLPNLAYKKWTVWAIYVASFRPWPWISLSPPIFLKVAKNGRQCRKKIYRGFSNQEMLLTMNYGSKHVLQ